MASFLTRHTCVSHDVRKEVHTKERDFLGKDYGSWGKTSHNKTATKE